MNKNILKQACSIILLSIIEFGLSACGSEEPSPSTTPSASIQQSNEESSNNVESAVSNIVQETEVMVNQAVAAGKERIDTAVEGIETKAEEMKDETVDELKEDLNSRVSNLLN